MRFGFALPSFSFPISTTRRWRGCAAGQTASAGASPTYQSAGLEYLVLSPLEDELAQLDLWEAEVLRHFRAG